jgi:hypothetical protein
MRATSYQKIIVVTVKEVVEGGAWLDIPMSLEVLAAAKRKDDSEQKSFL